MLVIPLSQVSCYELDGWKVEVCKIPITFLNAPELLMPEDHLKVQ